MRIEAPICKRCCFCLPLRYGLLAWAYLKVAIDLLMGSCLILIAMLFRIFVHATVNTIFIVSLILAIFIIDIVLNLVFIVGAHRKMVKLLEIYYIYTIILWSIMAILTVTVIISSITRIPSEYNDTVYMYYIAYKVITVLLYFVIQTYFLFLVRSEIIKLKNIGNFHFVNNAAEAECTLQIPEYKIEHEELYNIEDNKDSEQICEKTLHAVLN